MRQTAWLIATTLLLFLAVTSAGADDPWADAVVAFDQGPYPVPGPYSDPGKALGIPSGAGAYAPDNRSVVCLGGQGGRLTLRFNTPVTDDPANPGGLDCIVFGNAFWVGGNPQTRLQEPALIEISEDVNGNGQADDPWYLIPGSRGFSYVPFPAITEPTGGVNSATEPYWLAGYITNPNTLADADPANDGDQFNWGYADMSPTIEPWRDNYVRPNDPTRVGHTQGAGGGDAFDIAWAVDDEGNPGGLNRFHFIRLTSFISRNMGAVGYASPEIDAVADVAPEIDTDGDGVLDEYEIRVAGTDPFRRESTVIGLAIPVVEGGSPAGGLLGTVEDVQGTRIRFYSSGERDFAMARNATVDIVTPAVPSAALPEAGLLKSGAVRELVCSENDFVAAQIEPVEVTIRYTAGDISGLDEEGLRPFLFRDGTFTTSGLSDTVVNAAANQVTFRTRYAGTCLLASGPGAGDTGSTEGPQGNIALSADPASSVVASPDNSVQISSGPILDQANVPVGDGTLFTVTASRGAVVSPDLDGSRAGVQVASVGGAISFVVQAPTQAGAAVFTAVSVLGAAYGELDYVFAAGSPAGVITWRVGKPEGDVLISFEMTSSRVCDQFGNAVPDGTMLTLIVDGAEITSGDADSGQPGHQALVAHGVAIINMAVPSLDDEFTLSVYSDPTLSMLLGSGVYSPMDYVPMPLDGAGLLLGVGTIVLFAVLFMRKERSSHFA